MNAKVYIVRSRVGTKRFYHICTSVYHAMSIIGYYCGHLYYECVVLPYEIVPCTFEDFIFQISGAEPCDLSRMDVIAFEFEYSISLQITDLYE